MSRTGSFKTFLESLKDWCAHATDAELLTLASLVAAEITKRGLHGPGTSSPPTGRPRPREGSAPGTRESRPARSAPPGRGPRRLHPPRSPAR